MRVVFSFAIETQSSSGAVNLISRFTAETENSGADYKTICKAAYSALTSGEALALGPEVGQLLENGSSATRLISIWCCGNEVLDFGQAVHPGIADLYCNIVSTT
ncbi:MAG: hypothetical protein MRY21_04330 [Simkaniaceae bacterium]|nr:hypothetical protein [Simkaniaceae bacterium]